MEVVSFRMALSMSCQMLKGVGCLSLESLFRFWGLGLWWFLVAPLGEYSGSSLKSFIGFYAIHLSYFPCVVELFPLTVGRCPVFMTTSWLLILWRCVGSRTLAVWRLDECWARKSGGGGQHVLCFEAKELF
jgi:hypothetical protein